MRKLHLEIKEACKAKGLKLEHYPSVTKDDLLTLSLEEKNPEKQALLKSLVGKLSGDFFVIFKISNDYECYMMLCDDSRIVNVMINLNYVSPSDEDNAMNIISQMSVGRLSFMPPRLPISLLPKKLLRQCPGRFQKRKTFWERKLGPFDPDKRSFYDQERGITRSIDTDGNLKTSYDRTFEAHMGWVL